MDVAVTVAVASGAGTGAEARAWAQSLLDQSVHAAGAFRDTDGAMVDEAVLRKARRILERTKNSMTDAPGRGIDGRALLPMAAAAAGLRSAAVPQRHPLWLGFKDVATADVATAVASLNR